MSVSAVSCQGVAQAPFPPPPDVRRGGPDGLELLLYGTREPNDMCFYPTSGKIALRGLGVIGRLEQLDYWDGEA